MGEEGGIRGFWWRVGVFNKKGVALSRGAVCIYTSDKGMRQAKKN